MTKPYYIRRNNLNLTFLSRYLKYMQFEYNKQNVLYNQRKLTLYLLILISFLYCFLFTTQIFKKKTTDWFVNCGNHYTGCKKGKVITYEQRCYIF